MSFEEAYNNYLEYAIKRHKKQGFITLRHDFNLHILPYFKDTEISKILKQDILDWQNIILDFNFSNKYNTKLYCFFSSFIKFCIVSGYLQDNVLQQVGPFPKKIEKSKFDVYNIFEFRWFRFHLKDFVLKQYFNFMFFYGTRPSETMALRFLDLDFLKININHSIHRKGDRDLDLPKNQSSLRSFKISLLMYFRIFLLKLYYKRKYGYFSKDYFIFGGKKPLSPTTIDRYKLEACKLARIRPITQHQFRHSYATRKIHKRVSIDVVSRSMGHSKVSTTLDIYLHQEKNAFQHFFQ